MESPHQQPCYFQISRHGSRSFVDSNGEPCRKCPPYLSGEYCRSCDQWLFGTKLPPSRLCHWCLGRGQPGNCAFCAACHFPLHKNPSASKHAMYSCWRCRKKGVTKCGDLPIHLYYCRLCEEEMYPPTKKSRPRHGRICHICEVARDIQRTKFGNERKEFCPPCDFDQQTRDTNGMCSCNYCDMAKEIRAIARKCNTINPWKGLWNRIFGNTRWCKQTPGQAQKANPSRPRRYSIIRDSTTHL